MAESKFIETPLGTKANAWDAANRMYRSDSWFEGGRVSPSARQGFEQALKFGGEKIAAHGMAKEGTLTGGVQNLLKILKEGLDPKRGGGELYTAPLVSGAKGAGAGFGTASGSAYSDGPFMLLQRPNTKGLTGNLKNLGAILVNEANPEIVEDLREAVKAIRPDIVVDTYGNAGGVVEHLNNPKKPYVSQNIKPVFNIFEEAIPDVPIRSIPEEAFLRGRGFASTQLPPPPEEIFIETPSVSPTIARQFKAQPLPPPPAEIVINEPVFTAPKTASAAGRDLMPAARTLGRALGTEAASLGGMALRGAGRLAGPVGLLMTAYDAATMGPAALRDFAYGPWQSEYTGPEMEEALRQYKTSGPPATATLNRQTFPSDFAAGLNPVSKTLYYTPTFPSDFDARFNPVPKISYYSPKFSTGQ
jgi:hypothetical protein